VYKCSGALPPCDGKMVAMTDHATSTAHHIQMEKLTGLSAQIEELFAQASSLSIETVPPELADEIAATAGEIMVALAGDEADELVRGALADARRLREAARTLSPARAQIDEAGAALARGVRLIIRHDKRAA
jgi:hypothetical protein